MSSHSHSITNPFIHSVTDPGPEMAEVIFVTHVLTHSGARDVVTHINGVPSVVNIVLHTGIIGNEESSPKKQRNFKNKHIFMKKVAKENILLIFFKFSAK